MTVPVAMVAAVAENGVIGNKGGIPWRLPSDMAFFKRMTMGKPIVMGRKQYESVGKPLPGRTNMVVTRQRGYQPEGVLVVSALEAALEHAQAIASADRASEVMIIGGGNIYAQAMPFADRLYITHVALAPDGDTFFPVIDEAEWEAAETLDVPRTERDGAAFVVKLYTRRNRIKR